MKIIDKQIIEKVLEIRVEELKNEKNKIITQLKQKNKTIPDNEILYALSEKNVSHRKHPETRKKVKKLYNIDDIVVNDGGSQNNKMQKLDKDNKKYIHITTNMIGYEKDKKRGF